MLSSLETLILRGLTQNESYSRKVLPYVKDVYFETTSGRTLFSIFSEYFLEFNRVPTREATAVKIESIKGISE